MLDLDPDIQKLITRAIRQAHRKGKEQGHATGRTEVLAGLKAIAGIADVDGTTAPTIRKAIPWSEDDHPRDKNGRWIEKGDLAYAHRNPEFRKKLEASVHPEDRHKLDRAIEYAGTGKLNYTETPDEREEYDSRPPKAAQPATPEAKKAAAELDKLTGNAQDGQLGTVPSSKSGQVEDSSTSDGEDKLSGLMATLLERAKTDKTIRKILEDHVHPDDRDTLARMIDGDPVKSDPGPPAPQVPIGEGAPAPPLPEPKPEPKKDEVNPEAKRADLLMNAVHKDPKAWSDFETVRSKMVERFYAEPDAAEALARHMAKGDASAPEHLDTLASSCNYIAKRTVMAAAKAMQFKKDLEMTAKNPAVGDHYKELTNKIGKMETPEAHLAAWKAGTYRQHLEQIKKLQNQADQMSIKHGYLGRLHGYSDRSQSLDAKKAVAKHYLEELDHNTDPLKAVGDYASKGGTVEGMYHHLKPLAPGEQPGRNSVYNRLTPYAAGPGFASDQGMTAVVGAMKEHLNQRKADATTAETGRNANMTKLKESGQPGGSAEMTDRAASADVPGGRDEDVVKGPEEKPATAEDSARELYDKISKHAEKHAHQYFTVDGGGRFNDMGRGRTQRQRDKRPYKTPASFEHYAGWNTLHKEMQDSFRSGQLTPEKLAEYQDRFDRATKGDYSKRPTPEQAEAARAQNERLKSIETKREERLQQNRETKKQGQANTQQRIEKDGFDVRKINRDLGDGKSKLPDGRTVTYEIVDQNGNPLSDSTPSNADWFYRYVVNHPDGQRVNGQGHNSLSKMMGSGELRKLLAKTTATITPVPQPATNVESADTKHSGKVQYVRASKGGQVSDVDGKFYRGGQLMPVHGMYSGMEKKKGDGSTAATPIQANENSKGKAPRLAAQPLTPEQAEERRQKIEDQRKWDEINSGPLGQFKWLGDKPNSKAAEYGSNYKQWKEYAEKVGPEAVNGIVNTLEPKLVANLQKAGVKPEDIDYYLSSLKGYANDDIGTNRGKVHEAKIPNSHYARHLIHAMMDKENSGHADSVTRLHSLHSDLDSAIKSSVQPATAAGQPDGGETGGKAATPAPQPWTPPDIKPHGKPVEARMAALTSSLVDPATGKHPYWKEYTPEKEATLVPAYQWIDGLHAKGGRWDGKANAIVMPDGTKHEIDDHGSFTYAKYLANGGPTITGAANKDEIVKELDSSIANTTYEREKAKRYAAGFDKRSKGYTQNRLSADNEDLAGQLGFHIRHKLMEKARQTGKTYKEVEGEWLANKKAGKYDRGAASLNAKSGEVATPTAPVAPAKRVVSQPAAVERTETPAKVSHDELPKEGKEYFEDQVIKPMRDIVSHIKDTSAKAGKNRAWQALTARGPIKTPAGNAFNEAATAMGYDPEHIRQTSKEYNELKKYIEDFNGYGDESEQEHRYTAALPKTDKPKPTPVVQTVPQPAPSKKRAVSSPLDRKGKAPGSTGDSLYSIVRSYGGIDPDSHALKAHFGSIKEAREYGLALGLFKKGGNGLDSLAEELHNAGHIVAPEGADKTEHLVEQLVKKARSAHADRTAEYDKALDDHYRAIHEEQEAQKKEGTYGDAAHRSKVEKAIRDGQETGRSEAQERPYGSGHEGTGSTAQEEYDPDLDFNEGPRPPAKPKADDGVHHFPAFGNRNAFSAKFFPGRNINEVGVGYANNAGPQTYMPKESAKHFVNDLSGKVDVPANSGNHVVDSIASGKGEMLGKGDDGVVFGVGDKVAKMSTTVPFQPFNPGHRSPADAARTLESQVEVNNKLADMGIPGIMKQELVKHGDKAFAIRDRLEMPEKLTHEQLQKVRHAIDRIHAAGYVVGDDVQVGLKDGEPYLYDLGKAQKARDENDYKDDSHRFGRFAEQMGGEHMPLRKHAESALQSHLDSRDFWTKKDGSTPKWAAQHESNLRRGIELSKQAEQAAKKPIKATGGNTDLFGRELPKNYAGKKGPQLTLDDAARETWVRKIGEWADKKGVKVDGYNVDGTFTAGGKKYQMGGAESGYKVTPVGGINAAMKPTKLDQHPIHPESAKKFAKDGRATAWRIHDVNKPIPKKSANMWTDSDEKMPGTSGFANLSNALDDMLWGVKESATGENYTSATKSPAIVAMHGRSIDGPGAEVIVPDAKVSVHMTKADIEKVAKEAFKGMLADPADINEIDNMSMADIVDKYGDSIDDEVKAEIEKSVLAAMKSKAAKEQDETAPSVKKKVDGLSESAIVKPTAVQSTTSNAHNATVVIRDKDGKKQKLVSWPYRSETAKAVREGSMSADELKARFEHVAGNHDSIKAHLSDVLKKTGMRSPEKIREQADAIYDGLLDDLTPGKPISYLLPLGNPEAMKKARLDAYRKANAEITDDHLKEHAEKIAARSAAVEKTLTNPETYEEYSQFIRQRGRDQLNPEQRAKWDELQADRRRDMDAQDRARRATVAAVETGGVGHEIHEGFHTKHNKPIHIVKLGGRVGSDTFKTLAESARKLGGNYQQNSKWTRGKSPDGFNFDTRENAERFAKLLGGESVSRLDDWNAAKDESRAATAERLRGLADRTHESATESLNQERLTNTHRRAGMAASAEASARSKQAFAATLHRVADAIEQGKARHLLGVRAGTHLETLDHALRMAQHGAIRQYEKENPDASYTVKEDMRNRPAQMPDIDHAEFPYPYFDKSDLLRFAAKMRETPGAKRLAEKVRKFANAYAPADGNGFHVKNSEILSSFADVARSPSAYGLDKGDGEAMKYRMDRFMKLHAADIKNGAELRAALREYLPLKSAPAKEDPIKAAERSLVGNKIPGFFPTPRPAIDDMLSRADIQPGMSVLEPSAGKGDILDAIKENHPDVQTHAIEPHSSLREILEKKGHNLVGHDFLEHNGQYDRVVMNPPFENSQDIDHVQHAYNQLKPGGKIVAIMSEGPFGRSDKKANEFRQWLQQVDGESEAMPEGSFAGNDAFRKTGVRTRMVTIHKP